MEYNAPHLERLATVLEAGGGACLVGAGTSIDCGYPGWGAFLNALEEPLRRKLAAEYLAELRAKDVRTRLDDMAAMLAGDYLGIFRATFEPRGDGRDTPEWIRLLFDLNLRLLLTTNYTAELEVAAHFHPSSPLGENPDAVRWHQGQRLNRALRRVEGRLQLIYLHGRWDDSPERRMSEHGQPWSHVVLGEESYRYAYLHPGNVKDALGTVCGSHTLLVIGASLRDEDEVSVLRLAATLAGIGGQPHYAVLPLYPGEDPAGRGAELHQRYGLVPLFYRVAAAPNGQEDHGGLEILLRDLTERVASQAARPAPAVEVPVAVGEYPPRPRIVHALLRAADFEPRPQLQRPIEEFLKREEGGVLALVGIGGAGKTALVREALGELLALRLRPAYAGGIFVWSFYDQPDADAFFRSLAGYVSHEESPENWKEAKAYDAFRRACRPEARLLLVLDGLEKLQLERPDDKRVHGSLESPLLRQFLLWLLQVPGAGRAVVTSRFPLTDLSGEAANSRWTTLDLDALTRPQARALLRRRGVTGGGDRDLDALLDHFGAHALTVDHLGGAIVAYLEGNPRRFRELGEGPLTRFETGQAGKRLARIVSAYLGYLSREEPAVRDALQRIAVFPRPVGVRLLAQVFLAPGRERWAGSLAGAGELELKRCLRRLVELRFLREERLGEETVYTLHPTLRDAVLAGLSGERRDLAQAAREGLEEQLDLTVGRPGDLPTDPAALDFVELLIGFCVEAGELERAFELYWYRLGHYLHLGWKLGEYALGERIVRRLVEATAASEVFPKRSHGLLVADLALNLESVGRIEEAVECSSENARAETWSAEPNQLCTVFQNLSEARLLAGSLSASEVAARQGLETAEETADDYKRSISYSWLAAARGALGRVAEALADFTTCRQLQNRFDGNRNVLYSVRGFYLEHLLLRLGQAGNALAQAKASQDIHESNGWKDDIARSCLTRAEACRQLGRPREAAEPLEQARSWALESGEHEILLYARLFGAWLLHDRGELQAARDEGEDGLRTADTCGFGLFSIDFRILLGHLALEQGELDWAASLAMEALARADDPECQYFWGGLDAHEVLARIEEARGNPGAALDHRRAAEALRARLDVPDDLIRPLLPDGDDAQPAPAA
jgi:hypothetical protein